jgi:hypothetical protein
MSVLGARSIGLMVAAVLCLLAGRSVAGPASPARPAGWAVIFENDWYSGRYHGLPDGYRNSTRMLGVLVGRGWPADHILLVRDNLDPRALPRALRWLAVHVRPGDTALLYVAGEYEFLARDLEWARTVPPLWRRVRTSRRVVIVESCFAERLASAVRTIPGMALPAVGADEWDLWGFHATGPLIQGGAFTYYLARALEQEPRDAPLAFGPAFADAVVETRAYFRTVVMNDPVARDAYHAVGAFPERLAQFPNPHLIRGESDVSMAARQGAARP